MPYVPKGWFGMYLKQIELENFKSFGGKVTVPLMDGYMAVTGPNGSGKSNIGDAILFVLGPRSPKAVRAGRITDLIFNGGSSRSRASYMKVSLVFDNKDRIMPWDDDTVTLTRYVKLNDNGVDYSSYFFINDQKSTLTEFDRLLTKARISADGYNIVQQGDVTSIVEIGAVERRKILDGISGIASFDADLQAAGAERVEVNSNLERVEFIRSEKEKTVRQLEKDRAEAMKYKEVKDRLDTATAQLTVRQRDNQKATYESIVSSLDGTEKELEELSRKKAEAIEQRDSNEKAVSEKDAEIEARLGSEYTKVKQDVEEAKIKVASEKSRADAASEDIEKQKAFREGFVQDNEENRSQRQTLTDNLSDLEIKKKDADTELSTALAEEKSIREETASHGGEMTDLQKKLEAVEKQIDAAARSEQEASSRQAAVGSVLENAKNAKDQAEQAVESARFEVKDADWNLQEIKRQAGPQNEAEELGNKILALKKQESELEKQEDELRSIADKKTAEYNRLSTEKRVTESLNSGSEALSRILTLKESGEIKGIRGTVAQLATVDPGYETAAAVAAGGKMNAVVVDNKNVGAECINYLKRNGLGRLTFLPMDEMMPGKPRAKAIMVLKRTDGYISGFVEYKPEYENVFWYVFGDTLVVGDLDKA
ncbi:MAG: AAA family ATPase, partial [Methanomethylophilus sp.]|nr:AAA family ATPase [Methanomethylophilus sp.]